MFFWPKQDLFSGPWWVSGKRCLFIGEMREKCSFLLGKLIVRGPLFRFTFSPKFSIIFLLA